MQIFHFLSDKYHYINEAQLKLIYLRALGLLAILQSSGRLLNQRWSKLALLPTLWQYNFRVYLNTTSMQSRIEKIFNSFFNLRIIFKEINAY